LLSLCGHCWLEDGIVIYPVNISFAASPWIVVIELLQNPRKFGKFFVHVSNVVVDMAQWEQCSFRQDFGGGSRKDETSR